MAFAQVAALVIFCVVVLATVLLVLVPVSVPLPLPARLRRHCPISSITLSYAWVPVAGTLAMLATGVLDADSLAGGIVGDANMKPYGIVILFMALAYMASSLDMTGCFQWLALHLTRLSRGNGLALFLLYYTLSSLITIFTSNDVSIMTLTPIIYYFSRATSADPIPFLTAEFTAANIWSMLLFVGNPTNIIVAMAYKFSFFGYSKWMALPTLGAGLISLCVVLLLHYKHIPKRLQLPELQPAAMLVDKPGAILGAANVLVCLGLLAAAPALHWELWVVTLVCAGLHALYNFVAYVLLAGRWCSGSTATNAAALPPSAVAAAAGSLSAERPLVEAVDATGLGASIAAAAACQGPRQSADIELAGRECWTAYDSGGSTQQRLGNSSNQQQQEEELLQAQQMQQQQQQQQECGLQHNEQMLLQQRHQQHQQHERRPGGVAAAPDPHMAQSPTASCCVAPPPEYSAALVRKSSGVSMMCEAQHTSSSVLQATDVQVSIQDCAETLRCRNCSRQLLLSLRDKQAGSGAPVALGCSPEGSCQGGCAAGLLSRCRCCACGNPSSLQAPSAAPPAAAALQAAGAGAGSGSPCGLQPPPQPKFWRALRVLPWEVVPFVLGMFCVVEGLNTNGWVDRLAVVLGRGLQGNVWAALFGVGALSLLLANIINNQPMTILMTRVCMSPAFIQAASTSVAAGATSAAVPVGSALAVVVASNTAANFSVMGALAGIMFINILQQRGMKALGYVKFSTLMLPSGIASTVVALVLLGAELVSWPVV